MSGRGGTEIEEQAVKGALTWAVTVVRKIETRGARIAESEFYRFPAEF